MAIKTYLVSGEASYAKVLGKAPPGYEDGPAEWVVDVILNKDGIEQYKKSGGDEFYIKTNKDTGAQYLRFSRKAIKLDLSEGKPIQVVDHEGKEWDQTKLIGNGSKLNVKFSLNEVKSKSTKRLKPSILAIQVWEHKKYESKTGFPTRVDTPEEAAQDW